MAVDLYPHQIKAIQEMHNGCILKGDVGTGKTMTALGYFYMKVCGGMPKMPGVDEQPMKTPKDIYVITTAKKRDDLDWEKEAAYFPISRDSGGDGVQIHVDSWNNISQYELVDDAFFIFDEQRLVGSGAWVKAFLEIASKNEWIVLSATPGDVWMDYIPVFVANGFYKNRTEFIRRHVVFSRFSKFPKVERYVEQYHLETLRARVQVEMPYERHTIRVIRNFIVQYNKELYDRVVKDRWNIYEDRPIKNSAELFQTMRKVVNSDISRQGAIMKLLESHPKLIVFYNFNYELEMLRIIAKVMNYPIGEWNGKKHEPVPGGDKWLYIVQYTAGAEGWNCTTTDAMAFYSLNYSYKVNHQSKGRIDRLDTPFRELYYYILRSAAPIDTAITQSIAMKKNFNEKKFVKDTYHEDPFLKEAA